MYTSEFKSTDSDHYLHTPNYSPSQTTFVDRESPIKRYMRQNNFYLLLHQQAQNKGQSSMQNYQELKNLKQFERELQEERQAKIIQITQRSPKNKQKKLLSPTSVKNEEYVQRYVYEQDPVYDYRVKETNHFGNRVLNKIKEFIVDQKPSKSPRTPLPKRHPHNEYDYIASIQKLHKTNDIRQVVRRDQYLKKYAGTEMKQVKPFKIDNPISLYLLEKKTIEQGGHIPLYQRTIDLAKQKSHARLYRQLEKQVEDRIKEQEEILKFEELRRQKYYHVMTKQKHQEFINKLAQKDKVRNQAKQKEKIQYLKKVTRIKPEISKNSKELFHKFADKNDFSKDFVQRTEQYKFQREKSKLLELQKHDAEYCPFTPKISEASRNLAQKYQERKKLEEQSNKKYRHQKQLFSKLNQMCERMERSKSPVNPNSISHKRTTSAHHLKTKPAQEKETKKGKGKVQRQVQPNMEDIPIYNRYTPPKKRTNSCLMIGYKN